MLIAVLGLARLVFLASCASAPEVSAVRHVENVKASGFVARELEKAEVRDANVAS
jgi:hypothetical protein